MLWDVVVRLYPLPNALVLSSGDIIRNVRHTHENADGAIPTVKVLLTTKYAIFTHLQTRRVHGVG